MRNVALVRTLHLDRFQDHDFQAKSYRVYTTLDMNLQQAASEAVRVGIQEVALVGGRNYGVSRLNHATAKRQPGSIFKPFVYATAFNTGLEDAPRVITPLTQLVDEPTTFWRVNVRQAMSKSMNVPTVKVAEMAGYDKVAELAIRAGLNADVKGTPAVALGAYEVTPIEMAGAYTVFVDQGVYVKPSMIKLIRDASGHAMYESKPERRNVLDPRVAYMVVAMMEEVLRSGTGAGVRGRGFLLPAAGKTGTAHDGWFAGFTSNLICVVWVGFDDNRELKLEGAKAALPAWAEFMKRAHQYREYRNVQPFSAPEGIVTAEVDPATGYLAAPNCPGTRTEVFIAGTQPVEICRVHGGGGTRIAGWETTAPGQPAGETVASTEAQERPAVAQRKKRAESVEIQPLPAEQQQPKQPAKKGFFDRLRGLFK